MSLHSKKIKWMSYLLICLSLFGCKSENGLSTDLYEILGIASEEINTKFTISAPNGWNSFRIGDSIGLVIDLVSKDQISFSYDYGAKIYINERNKWIEIENIAKYPVGSFIVTPDMLPQDIPGAVVDPKIQKTDEPITVWVILFGDILTKDGKFTGDKTAASISIQLNP